MKTTKTKLVLSICALVVFAACTKSDSSDPLDCMRIENGTAISDDCGDCHKWMAYNYVTHAVRDVNDTITEVLLENEMFTSPNNPMNPAWNFCPDCNGISNGPALIDSCRDCQLAYIYDFQNHIAIFIDDTTGVSDTLDPAQYMIGLPDDPSNPYWNSGCK